MLPAASQAIPRQVVQMDSLLGQLVANGWCWFVVREKYY
jgi:hypothetical protein